MKRKVSILLALVLILSCMTGFAEAESEVILSIESKLSASAFTTGKSTLKRARGIGLTFDEGSEAVLTLTLASGEKIDDSLIDASNAVVQLIDGDGYYAAEYIFTATDLSGEWENGQIRYVIEDGEFDLDRSLYLQTDDNSGREWSCLGGDGHGNYKYDLLISGITYDGKPVEAQTFPMKAKIYGFNYSGDAAKLYGDAGTPTVEATLVPLADAKAAESVSWIWTGEGEKPILCDAVSDNFYAVWPAGADMSDAEVSVSLTNDKGDVKILTAGQDYQIAHFDSQTQIALTYINWAFQPVYTTLNIALGAEQAAFEIGSVYVYEAQQGGGGTTIDGTVTAYSFYGLANLTAYEQLMSPAIYVLSCQKDETTFYYTEDEQGNGKLVEDMTLAKTFDASGAEDRNQQLVGNTLYITTRKTAQSVSVTVDGADIELTKTYPGRKDAISGGGSLLNPSACDPNLEALPGYVIPWGTENWITNEKWAWQNGVNEGWTGIEVTPYSGKFEHSVIIGQSQQFTAMLNGEAVDVKWSIIGDKTEGTSISADGVLTVGAEEPTSAYFAVVATDANGEVGCVSIKVVKE